jgi:hypothetical protein
LTAESATPGVEAEVDISTTAKLAQMAPAGLSHWLEKLLHLPEDKGLKIRKVLPHPM